MVHIFSAFAEGQLVNGRANETVPARGVIVGPVFAAIERIHDAAITRLSSEAVGIRTTYIVDVFGPGVRAREG